MSRFARALAPAKLAAVAAGSLLAVSAAMAATPPMPGLTAFGATAIVLPGAYDTKLPSSLAASQALSPNLAVDTGYNTEAGARFAGNDELGGVLRDNGASYLALADGGRYLGATYMPATDLRLRLGTALRNDRVDNFAFAPLHDATGLPLAFDRGETQSLLGGISWNVSSWATLGLNAIASLRSGAPFGHPAGGALTDRAHTRALDVSARFSLGGSWVTNLDYGRGTTQLDAREGAQQGEAYAFAVAKRGVFGDDAVGFSLSRPIPGMTSSFGSLASLGEVPAMILPDKKGSKPSRETDIQLGYITNFLNGKLALQTNAGYQMNVQGQDGASAVSILSRAKIKF